MISLGREPQDWGKKNERKAAERRQTYCADARGLRRSRKSVAPFGGFWEL